jgi:hypothetical protein
MRTDNAIGRGTLVTAAATAALALVTGVLSALNTRQIAATREALDLTRDSVDLQRQEVKALNKQTELLLSSAYPQLSAGFQLITVDSIEVVVAYQSGTVPAINIGVWARHEGNTWNGGIEILAKDFEVIHLEPTAAAEIPFPTTHPELAGGEDWLAITWNWPGPTRPTSRLWWKVLGPPVAPQLVRLHFAAPAAAPSAAQGPIQSPFL